MEEEEKEEGEREKEEELLAMYRRESHLPSSLIQEALSRNFSNEMTMMVGMEEEKTWSLF